MKDKRPIIMKVTISDYNTGLWYGRSINVNDWKDEQILNEIASFLEDYHRSARIRKAIARIFPRLFWLS